MGVGKPHLNIEKVTMGCEHPSSLGHHRFDPFSLVRSICSWVGMGHSSWGVTGPEEDSVMAAAVSSDTVVSAPAPDHTVLGVEPNAVGVLSLARSASHLQCMALAFA